MNYKSTHFWEWLRLCPSRVHTDLSSYLDTSMHKQNFCLSGPPVHFLFPGLFALSTFLGLQFCSCLYPIRRSSLYVKLIHGSLRPGNYPRRPIITWCGNIKGIFLLSCYSLSSYFQRHRQLVWRISCHSQTAPLHFPLTFALQQNPSTQFDHFWKTNWWK